MAKSTAVAYFLWFFGGFYGLHHLYLGRDRQAFLWWAFGGGYFGCGWLRDLWRIPHYVEEANESQKYLEKLTYKMVRQKVPDVGWARFSGMMMVGNTFGYLAISAIPMELVPETIYPLFYTIIPAGCAFGIYLVGNIGRHKGSIRVPLIGAYITLPIYYLYGTSYMFTTTLFACYAFTWYGVEWRRQPSKQRHFCKRLLILALSGSLYLSLWSSTLYFNTTITDSEGNEIKLRDAVKHFMKSPMWHEFNQVMTLLYNHIRYNGFKEIWNELLKAFDPSGSHNAYKVLNLTGNETPEQVTMQYRQLSRKWHPDKHKDPQMKKEAQEKFMEVQEAYNIISSLKNQREKRNKKHRSD